MSVASSVLFERGHPSPKLTRLFWEHLEEFGTDPEGRLFTGVRGGPLATITYRRAWSWTRIGRRHPPKPTTGHRRSKNPRHLSSQVTGVFRMSVRCG